MTDIEQQESEQLARKEHIKATAASVDKEAREARELLEKLGNRYALALAEHALGEFSKGKLEELKSELDKLTGIVLRAPKALEGLKILELEVQERLKLLSKEVQRLRLQERYDELKAQLEECFDKHQAMTLRQLAGDLGCYWETVEFIEKLEHEWRNRPLSAV